MLGLILFAGLFLRRHRLRLVIIVYVVCCAVKPSTSKEYNPIEKDYGDSVELSCEANGTPTPRIYWYMNGNLVEPQNKPNKYVILSNGNLQVKNLMPSDAGMYQCLAFNQAGNIDTTTWLKVRHFPPFFTKLPVNIVVIEGNQARFTCEADGAPKPTITWMRGTTAISPSSRIQLNSNGEQLLISNTVEADSGPYKCIANNDKGSQTTQATLSVYVKTVIVEPPQDTSRVMGSDVLMRCGVKHSASVKITIKWYNNDRLINDQRMIVHDNGSLEIRQINTNDIGEYMCKVTSVSGNDSRSATLTVLELPYQPSITTVILDPLSNRRVIIRWIPGFDGNSEITQFIIQYREAPPGQTLLENEGWRMLVNKIDKLKREYTVSSTLLPARTYQFHVSAVNSVGEGQPSPPSTRITLPQQPPSGPPIGVVGSPRSQTSIFVTWQAPDASHWNGRLLGYKVRYKIANYPDSSFVIQEIRGTDRQTIELRGLSVFRIYQIEVAAFNAKGTGMFSSGIRVRTKEGVPVQAPNLILAEAVNSTAIKLKWVPPHPQKVNGINQGYKIYARVMNKTVYKIEKIAPDLYNQYPNPQIGFIVNLKKYTQYNVTLLCYTNEGNGPESTGKIVWTKEDIPDAVTHTEFTDIYDTTMRVSWKPPANINGILTGYTLLYGVHNQTHSIVRRDFPANVRQYVIKGLTAKTMYTITIYASTKIGPGTHKTVDIMSGEKPEKPGPPSNLVLSNLQARSVVVQFLPGYNGKTTISKWVVEAQIGPDSEWQTIYEEQAPNARALTVRNLRPFTDYSLRMYAVNIVAESEPSFPTRKFQTIQAEPSVAPGNVTVRAVDETSIRVRWTPLPIHEWNGVPLGYVIKYKHKDANIYKRIQMEDKNANGFLIAKLEEWTEYEIKVCAYNGVGEGPYSQGVFDRTRESAPSAGPNGVIARAESSTAIKVWWGPVPKIHQNGRIAGYKVVYSSSEINLPSQYLVISNPNATMAVVSGLRKYVQYEIQVLAFTRIGDGVKSPLPVIRARTKADKPGPPSKIYFPDVTYTTCKVVWSVPDKPNGVITGYSIAYRELNKNPPDTIRDDSLGPGRLEYAVTGLKQETTYVFGLKARTSSGWGEVVEVMVKTMINRRIPEAPAQPTISTNQIDAREASMSWQAKDDGYSYIRNYTVQYSTDSGVTWTNYRDTLPASPTTYTVKGLTPHTKYRFRIAACNDIGLSPFSQPSKEILTLQDKPGAPPKNLKVTPLTTTSVRVTWELPDINSLNGDLQGYRVFYRQLNKGNQEPSQAVTSATTIDLDGLTKGVYYEVIVHAYNIIGTGVPSIPVTVYVGEAIPTAPPQSVRCRVKGSTEVICLWTPPPIDAQNGDLLGFKVYYWAVNMRRRRKRVISKGSQVNMQAVPATENQVMLQGLKKHTTYQVAVLAFNPAGDGPNSTIITITTLEGVPSQPGPLVFTDIQMTSLNVSWTPPRESNGIITHYMIRYYPVEEVSGVVTKTELQVSGDVHFYLVSNLEENIRYTFTVQARTQVDWGKSVSGNVTTGPQSGSPGPPSRPTAVMSDTSATLRWKNGEEGASAVEGYIIQAKHSGGDWETILRTEDPGMSAVISFSNLKPNTNYTFRVIAINDHGISAPSLGAYSLNTPDFKQVPFYQQWWFLIIVALTALIVIIIIVSVLVITGRNKRHKAKQKKLGMYPRIEDGGFSTFQMDRTRRTSGSTMPNGTLTRPPPKYPKPPKSKSGLSTYSDEDDNYAKPPISSHGSHCSSITEKISDIDSDSQISDSEPDEKGAYAFTNPYVTRESIRKSWKDKTPAQAYSYTDSEPDNYAASVNIGRPMNLQNVAGSRAPLTGFSSFV
ncbi:protein sidekick-2-like [Tubulanus polymorphus]|uniref:protein sidekick-2-like n=1 Tax=Tubulanus polymorphus TaxID=672921 RepID=UPI003DA26B2B